MTPTSDEDPGAVSTRRGPGRPRAQGHDARIVAAAVELIDRGEEITVSRVVEQSGVSRAAIYRRWPSMTDLAAAALDHGREPYRIPLDGDLLENLLAAFAPTPQAAGQHFPEERFRLRIRLAMSNSTLAQAYWRSHVAVRRTALVDVLRTGISRGILRPDIDIDACIDLINGVFYYQYVVRGARFDDPQTMARCRTAVQTAWRGMSVDTSPSRRQRTTVTEPWTMP
ncbi:TetR/AcrR family transcriptional regulator [Oerskovia flava]|uniref:TetR/AcrR family transcriptional regulator n=1 Tax=Oerskovia flava TaxID=2986422 RepID=UPI00223FE69F|nr:TetR/AcrR family transcriptional regulator [Oerskovia sp. JB1-3-2]